MLELQVPTRHDWVQSDRTYGKLAIEAFESGFALAVGIAYRRVLLSAIHGAAPTWVKIENVLHEFSHMPGVTEDTLDIIMNLRKVVFALHVNRPKILRLKAQGLGTVKAGNCEPDADVDILTPDARQGRRARDGDLLRARPWLRVGGEARAGGAAHQRHPAGRQLLAGAARELQRGAAGPGPAR